MLLTLLKALNTNRLDILAGNLSMAPLDIDVLLYEAQENGDIKVDKTKGTVEALREPATLYYNAHLHSQILKIIKFYDQQEANITSTRLEGIALDPAGSNGYPNHEFVCTMYAIDHGDEVKNYEISVPKLGKRPFNRFKFYTFQDHQEFGAKAVNDFIAQFKKK